MKVGQTYKPINNGSVGKITQLTNTTITVKWLTDADGSLTKGREIFDYDRMDVERLINSGVIQVFDDRIEPNSSFILRKTKGQHAI